MTEQTQAPGTVGENGFLVDTPTVASVESPPSEPPKRRRGRPSNAEKAARSGLTPEALPGVQSKSAAPKKRKEKLTGEQLSNLANQISGLHMMAAMITKLPELQLHPKEAEMMAKSISDMAEQYDLSIDGKTGAALQLLATGAMIYVPRVFAIQSRLNNPPPKAPPDAAANDSAPPVH